MVVVRNPVTKYFFAQERETPGQLEPTTYFSFIEKIEEVFDSTGGHFIFYLDCVEIKKIKSDTTPEEFILLPSQILFCKIPRSKVFQSLGDVSTESFDGTWVKVATKRSSAIGISCQIDGVYLENSRIEVNTITPINELNPEEIEKYRNLINSFNLEDLSEDARAYDWGELEQRLNQFHHVGIYNVGQGNLTALCYENNLPLIYFDMGGGFGANKHTYPNRLSICVTGQPSVLLSHWHLDHIETALRSNQSHNLKWVVPLQPIGLTHFILAYQLNQLGNLFSLDTTQIIAGLSILKCTGQVKNDSGLALLIDFEKRILLPGDSSYRRIPNLAGLQLDGLLASHHASNRELIHNGINAIPLANNDESMLAFSYGQGNTYPNHNPLHIIATYRQRNWGNNLYLETPNGNIIMEMNAPNLNVPCQGNMCDLALQQHF